ncbi:MAG: hypothetical protein M1423_08600, partial [Acidobacteria bacterium]|nr:hypothetical protein [Acidobacteriota bacterium]
MPKGLRAEIKQKRPFASLEEEVALSLLRTADLLDQNLETLLKPSGLSATQYNVLRILRGAGEFCKFWNEAAVAGIAHRHREIAQPAAIF